jgi:mannose-6-phosphate isomerase-like protein (cupin superfamily)
VARWFEILAPQPKPAAAFKDLFFAGDDAWPAFTATAVGADVAGTGLFKAENPIPAQRSELAQGLSVYRFMERKFGAQCFYMMRGEMTAGAYRTRHDHPIEEFYLGLSGEVIMEIEDREFRLGAGDLAWTGVGTSHAFRNEGSVPFQWMETQTPQFPDRYGTRNYVEWEKLRAGR